MGSGGMKKDDEYQRQFLLGVAPSKKVKRRVRGRLVFYPTVLFSLLVYRKKIVSCGR